MVYVSMFFGAVISTVVRREPLSPLLKKERNIGLLALIAQGSRPIGMNWPGSGPGLSAADHPIKFWIAVVWSGVAVTACAIINPMITHQNVPAALRVFFHILNAGQIHRPQHRLHADKADGCRDLEQERDSLVCLLLVLGGDAKPEIMDWPSIGS